METAIRTGFSDQSHFTKYFNRFIGFVPGAYREIFSEEDGDGGNTVFRFIMGFAALFLFDFETGLERFADVTYLLDILYLGLGASALCFVTWNLAAKVLGAVKTSVYICIVPVITVVTSVLVLKEPVTWVSVIGTVLAVAGLFLSEYNGKVSRDSE